MNPLCECGCGQAAPAAKRTNGPIKKGQPLRFVAGHNLPAMDRNGEPRVPGVRHRHGLTEAERADLKRRGCQACGATDRRLVIDHDHDHCPDRFGCRECVRGVLCSSCNSALGLLQNDAVILINLFSYLLSHEAPARAALASEGV